MITVAAVLALAVWFLLDLLAPPPPSHQHMPSEPKPGPGGKPDEGRPLPGPTTVLLQQFEVDGRPLAFGAVAARDAVQLRVLGVDPDTPVVLSIERDGTPAGEGPAAVSPDGFHARGVSALTPGTYTWKARIGSDPATTRDYPAPVPAFIVAAGPPPVMTLDQSDHRQQSLPRGGRSEGGFHVHLHAAGARGDADIEVKPAGSDFNGAGLSTLQLAEGGARVWLPLSPGGYVWRARPRSGGNTGAWMIFGGGGPGPAVVVVPQVQPGTALGQPGQQTGQPQAKGPPQRQPQQQGPAPGASVGTDSGESDDDEGGGGRPKPRPSRVERPPTLWSLLTPEVAAIVAASAGVALAGLALLVRWRGR